MTIDRRGFVCALTALFWVAVPAGGEARADEGQRLSLVRAAEAGWPQWRGPRRDGISDEENLLQAWPEGGPKLLWKATGIGRGFSSPVVSGGAVYLTGDTESELVIAAFTTDGQLRWKTASGATWKKNYPGARASCCFDDGRVYHLNAHGDLVCLDAATGAKVWGVNLLERYEAKNITWGISESVLVHGDRVFATPAGAKGLVVAFDKRSGAEVWMTPAIEGEQAAYAAPILVDEGSRKVLVNCASAHTFGVDAATGALLWKKAHADPKNTVNVTPMLNGRRLFVTCSSRDYGAVCGLDTSGGSVARAWLRELKISHGGMLCVGGRLYGASSKGEATGWLALDAGDGRLTALDPSGVLGDGAAIYADGRFYLLTARGVMTLQDVTDTGFKPTGSFRLVEEKVQDAWAHPVLCDGRLYLRYHDTLFCYDVRR
jgi:outer membrane protein assembly factor BamB